MVFPITQGTPPPHNHLVSLEAGKGEHGDALDVAQRDGGRQEDDGAQRGTQRTLRAQRGQRHRGPLGVPHVGQRGAACHSLYVGRQGGEVGGGHVVEGKVPEGGGVGAQACVVAAVRIPPAVPQPNVPPRIRQDEGQALVRVVQHPGGAGIQQAVLQEHRAARGGTWRGALAAVWDAVGAQDVAIGGRDEVLLQWVPFGLHQLWDAFERVGFEDEGKRSGGASFSWDNKSARRCLTCHATVFIF